MMNEYKWNVILNTIKDDKIIQSSNNPPKSGFYLCTCIRFYGGKERSRYLTMMEYDKNKNCWHDIRHESSLSHNILAWTNIDVCDFMDYTYRCGGILTAK